MINIIQQDRVRAYWDELTEIYLHHMTTFQAGLFAESESNNPFHENAIEISRRAMIKSGHKVLDLGCGVCGPAIEIALHNPGVSFVCITDCEKQVEVAKNRVAEFGLDSQIKVLLLDYHDIDILPDQFDRCIFLESFGYTLNPNKLLMSVANKLKEDGQLYIKDVCRKWNLLASDIDELNMFNETYCYNTPLLVDVENNAREVGLSVKTASIITDKMYRAHSRSSMFVDPLNSDKLTEFGRRHFKGFKNLPVDFYELHAKKI